MAESLGGPWRAILGCLSIPLSQSGEPKPRVSGSDSSGSNSALCAGHARGSRKPSTSAHPKHNSSGRVSGTGVVEPTIAARRAMVVAIGHGAIRPSAGRTGDDLIIRRTWCSSVRSSILFEKDRGRFPRGRGRGLAEYAWVGREELGPDGSPVRSRPPPFIKAPAIDHPAIIGNLHEVGRPRSGGSQPDSVL